MVARSLPEALQIAQDFRFATGSEADKGAGEEQDAGTTSSASTTTKRMHMPWVSVLHVA
jgi:hypothetical protein